MVLKAIPSYFPKMSADIRTTYPKHEIVKIDSAKIGQYEYIDVLIRAELSGIDSYIIYESDYDHKAKDERKVATHYIMPHAMIRAAVEDMKKRGIA